MAGSIASAPGIVTAGDLGDGLAAFDRAMSAANVSPNTITAYAGAVRQFALWRIDKGHPTGTAAIGQRHVEEWIGGLLRDHKPATAHDRFRGLQRFFNWYATTDDTFVSPIRKMKPPRLPKRFAASRHWSRVPRVYRFRQEVEVMKARGAEHGGWPRSGRASLWSAAATG